MSDQLPQQRLTVPGEVDESEFYRMPDGKETLTTHADLEETVTNSEKPHLDEIQRYWVNKPYAFIVIYRNVRDNELRYISVEPRLSQVEGDIVKFFQDKLRTSIDYTSIEVDATPAERSRTVRDETLNLMKRYNLLKDGTLNEPSGITDYFKDFVVEFLERQADDEASSGIGSGGSDPLPQNPKTGEVQNLDSTQVRRILYYLVRDFIRFDRIDPIKQDVNIEDISCDGYDAPIFVYHSEYGKQLVSNIEFGVTDLDGFVKTLAQTAGKGISRRQPSVDATLSDGSRAQLTLGTETSDQGTNFTIRQFNDIPFTPVDLLNWRTFDIEQMTYMWLAIENNKSIVFAGGTASGKTTSLNAVSLFMPSTAKIVSIEDTRELEIPQANWVPRTTRESFQDDESGTVDEFDLLEDALRQRPDYVIMGEVRGEEGQTLFQMLNTGHTTYTTFHANKPREVIRRFTTDPINVSPSMFDALDIICLQESVDMNGTQVRRARDVVEVDEYNSSRNQFSMNDAFTWDRKRDAFRRKGRSQIVDDIQQENAWTDEEMQQQWDERKLVLSYLVKNNINTYAGVAATVQGYMSSPDTILGLISDGNLRARIAGLHKMKTINIDVDPEKEALIPRPRTPATVDEQLTDVLDENEALLKGYDGSGGDFAQTIEQMLGGDSLDESDRQYLKELEASDTAGELPPGVTEELTDSTSLSGANEDVLELDEELDKLFGEDTGESTDQMILTSETLEKINNDGASQDTQAGGGASGSGSGNENTDQSSSSLEDLFEDEMDGDDTVDEPQESDDSTTNTLEETVSSDTGSDTTDSVDSTGGSDDIGGVFDDPNMGSVANSEATTEADPNSHTGELGTGEIGESPSVESSSDSTQDGAMGTSGEDDNPFEFLQTEDTPIQGNETDTTTERSSVEAEDASEGGASEEITLAGVNVGDEESISLAFDDGSSTDGDDGRSDIDEALGIESDGDPLFDDDVDEGSKGVSEDATVAVDTGSTSTTRSFSSTVTGVIQGAVGWVSPFNRGEDSTATTASDESAEDVDAIQVPASPGPDGTAEESGKEEPNKQDTASLGAETEEESRENLISEARFTDIRRQIRHAERIATEAHKLIDSPHQRRDNRDTEEPLINGERATERLNQGASVGHELDQLVSDTSPQKTVDEAEEKQPNKAGTHSVDRPFEQLLVHGASAGHKLNHSLSHAKTEKAVTEKAQAQAQAQTQVSEAKPYENGTASADHQQSSPGLFSRLHTRLPRVRNPRSASRALFSASLVASGLWAQAVAIVVLTQYVTIPDPVIADLITQQSRLGSALILNAIGVGLVVLVTLMVNPVATRDYPWDGYRIGQLSRWIMAVVQSVPIVLTGVYVYRPELLPGPEQVATTAASLIGGIEGDIPAPLVELGGYYSQVSPLGYSPLDLVVALGATGVVLSLSLVVQSLRVRFNTQPASSTDPDETSDEPHSTEDTTKSAEPAANTEFESLSLVNGGAQTRLGATAQESESEEAPKDKNPSVTNDVTMNSGDSR